MSVVKALLRSRKFWLGMAGIGVVIATVGFGVGEEKANEIATSVVAIVIALMATIAIEDGATKLANGKNGQ
ncbi:MAG TPA: hypothetical protein VM238_18450 [Phycisphaerae bacterium]|nr:hypothetical protein [Phycisphaerae bacterium]